MTTMNEKYGDGSDHEVCDTCGYCKTCGDCDQYGCGNRMDASGLMHDRCHKEIGVGRPAITVKVPNA